MYPLWRSNLGKLIIGGCGLQIGLILSLTLMLSLSLLCVFGLFINLLMINLAQTYLTQPNNLSSATMAIPDEELAQGPQIDSLLQEVDNLLVAVANLRASRQDLPPGAIGSFSKPVIVAQKADVELRSGPGTDYDAVGRLLSGGSLEIVGRNGDSSWWLVSLPDGIFAWVPTAVVTPVNLNETIPVIMAPSALGQTAASGSIAVPIDPSPPPPTPTATATPAPPTPPPGTPTPAVDVARQFVEEMSAYKRLSAQLMVPPVSSSLSPDGSQIAVTERIKLYTVTTEGALTTIWFEDNDEQGPLGGAVWSPDGRFLAFLVGFKNPKCRPCRLVALLDMENETIKLLEGPDNLETDAPRWTQDGRLLVNVHKGEPADGITYVYDVDGRGAVASGVYTLSSSHDGQKWYPWLPGRVWQAGVSERPDSYYGD